MDFTVIERADLRQHEFAELVPVSRVTVNIWVQGHKAPHRYILSKVKTLVAVLEAAIEAGDLPMAKSTTNRSGALRQTIKDTIKRMQAA